MQLREDRFACLAAASWRVFGHDDERRQSIQVGWPAAAACTPAPVRPEASLGLAGHGGILPHVRAGRTLYPNCPTRARPGSEKACAPRRIMGRSVMDVEMLMGAALEEARRADAAGEVPI